MKKLFRAIIFNFIPIASVSAHIPHGIMHDAIKKAKYPIVYHDSYNMWHKDSIFNNTWLSKIVRIVHPFDGTKYRKIMTYLSDHIGITAGQYYEPAAMVSDEDLLIVHTRDYLNSLNNTKTISQLIDLDDTLAYLPFQKNLSAWLRQNIINPMKWATSGTIICVQLALRNKTYAINLGGGFHHARRDSGRGGCALADIPLAIKKLHSVHPGLNVLIIDLDAHQGEGIESILQNNPHVFIFDMYNNNVPPYDREITQSTTIRNLYPVPLCGGSLSSKFGPFEFPDVFERCINRAIGDDEYHHVLITHFRTAYGRAVAYFDNQKPDLIIYNAGTDPHQEDAWGCLNLSTEEIIARDAFIFRQALDKKIPIAMVLSGGYTAKSAQVIGESIVNILKNIIPGYTQLS